MQRIVTRRPGRQQDVFEVLARLAAEHGLLEEFELLEVIREGLQQKAARP